MDTPALEERRRRLFEVHGRAVGELQGNPSVVEIAIGFKVIDGVTTDLPAIIVHVREKRPDEREPAEQRIPRMIAEVPTEVMTYAPGAPEVHEPGDQIQPDRSTKVGTLGFFAQADAKDRTVACPA